MQSQRRFLPCRATLEPSLASKQQQICFLMAGYSERIAVSGTFTCQQEDRRRMTSPIFGRQRYISFFLSLPHSIEFTSCLNLLKALSFTALGH